MERSDNISDKREEMTEDIREREKNESNICGKRKEMRKDERREART